MHFTAFMMLIFINWKYHTCQSRKNVLLILAMHWPITQVRWSDYGAFGGVLCCKCGPPLVIHTPLLAFPKGIPKSQAFSDRILKWTIWYVNLNLHFFGILRWNPIICWNSQMESNSSINVLEFSIPRWNPLYFGILRWNPLSHFFRHSQIESSFCLAFSKGIQLSYTQIFFCLAFSDGILNLHDVLYRNLE